MRDNKTGRDKKAKQKTKQKQCPLVLALAPHVASMGDDL
jgi:hypothetical protein